MKFCGKTMSAMKTKTTTGIWRNRTFLTTCMIFGMFALVAAYNNDLQTWCDLAFPTAIPVKPTVDFTKLFGIEDDPMLDLLEDTGPLPTFALENSLMSDNRFCQMVGTFPRPQAMMGVQQKLSTEERNQAIAAIAERGLKGTPDYGASLRMICDSGASLSCLGNKDEFETLTVSKEPIVLKGIASGLEILGEGFANYDLLDNDEKVIRLRANAYWVPQLKNLRLLALQSLTTVDKEIMTLFCHGQLPNGSTTFSEILPGAHK